LPSGTSTDFGNLSRNSFRGPGYFNTDMSVRKEFRVKEAKSFGFRATAFNLFNHPNFANPVSDLANPDFGKIVSTVSGPTSPYGNGLGLLSYRMLQLGLYAKF